MKKDDNKKEINLDSESGIGFSQRDKNIKIQEEIGFLISWKSVIQEKTMRKLYKI